MKLDYTLSFVGDKWICFDESVEYKADNLDDIDDFIINRTKEQYQKGDFTINMYFDFDCFPTWHRQYMSHYFNREFSFSIT